jgi:hypothetical protein
MVSVAKSLRPVGNHKHCIDLTMSAASLLLERQSEAIARALGGDGREQFLVAQFIFDETKYRMLLKGKYTAQKRAGELSLLAAHGRVLVGDADRVLVEEELVLQPVGVAQSSGVTRL